MKQTRTAVMVILLLAVWLYGQQMPSEMQQLNEVKRRARVSLSDVPNYSCLETVDRSWQESANAVPEHDLLHVQVSVERGRESFAAPGGKSTTTENLAALSERGLSATGLFSMFASGLFTTSSAAIYGAESGDQELRYDFHLTPAFSGWKLMGAGATGQVGERGVIAVDAHSLRLLTMKVDADEIPSFLPYLSVHVFIDYSAGTVSGTSTFVPSSAEIWIKERSGELHDDRFFFSQCRKFSAASTVSFTDGGVGALTGEQVARNFSNLPGGLTLPVRLLAGVDSASAAPGDAVEAVVARDVSWMGKRLIRKGAPVKGHVRAAIRGTNSNANGLMVEFDQVATEAGSADFLAKFERGFLRENPNQAVTAWDAKTGEPGAKLYFAQTDIPGVVSFVNFGASCLLPEGMKMEWKFQDLHARDEMSNRDPLGMDPRFFGRGSALYPY